MASSRKAYHHGALAPALVEQALRSLEATPHGELSLRALSESLGVSHTAAYRHFPDKDALLDAVAARGYSAIRDCLLAAKGKPNLSVPRQFDRMAEAYVAFAIAQPNLYRLMFGPGFQERLRSESTGIAAREAFAVLLDAIQKGQAAKVFAAASPFLLSQTVWSLLHGIALFALDGELGKEQAAHVARAAWQFLYQGVKAS